MPEFIRNQPRRKRVRRPAFASWWGRQHPFCAACGAGEYGTHSLTNHHLIGGRGGRSDEACNLLRLGWHPCHQLAEGMTIHGEGEPCVGFPNIRKNTMLPKITLGIALSLKLRCDPEEMELERLQELRGSRLPEPEEIPRHFVDLWNRNRPEAH